MDILNVLLGRDLAPSTDPSQEVLNLLENPFAGQQVQQNSLYTAFATSLGFTAFIAICFSFLRPYNQAVYAPKLKHADDRHAPPPLDRSLWAWLTPIWKMKEHDLMLRVGMDAAVFLRFTRMCRNILLTLSILLCSILLPVHWTFSQDPAADPTSDDQKWLAKLTPSNVWNGPIWAQVVCAWLANLVIAAFLWWNYHKVARLRRAYFDSDEYQSSTHAHTLMLYDIPKGLCSDEGIARLVDMVAPDGAYARTAIARNVKDLPKLIGQHDAAIRRLEKVLAQYLRDPANLPAQRPTCKPSSDDPDAATYPAGHRVDAIDYLSQRIRALELEIEEVRRSVDKRSSMPYGFATYDDIAEAHRIAYAARKTKPEGAMIELAPRPNDVIWDNMPLSRKTRRLKGWMNTVWVTLLTLLWIGPNAMIAIFLVNLGNLGKVWPAFEATLIANTGFWGAVQGILSPALLSLFYLVLPIIFRRMAIRAGYQTKTKREMHVVAKLYSFFVFNNLLIFTFFSTIWGYAAGFIQAATNGQNVWATVRNDQIPQGLFVAICTISPFWVTWLLQRQLGAAIDLAQLWPLAYGFLMKRFSSPTPRELIELTAPPPFDYSSYYNYFLFYTTVALFYAGIQPLVLPAAALYFVIDVFLKKYLILYVFVTKTESGGVFWRLLIDRFIAGTILSNLVVLLTVWVRGYGTHTQFWAVLPLPFLMLAFRWVCTSMYDNKMAYYSTTRGNTAAAAVDPKVHARLRSEKLAARFGHPALYKPLMEPMVYERAKKLVQAIYKGRLSDGPRAEGESQRGSQGMGLGMDGGADATSGYPDSYALDEMAAGRPGKTEQAIPGFAFVADSQLDFEHYRHHPDFASDDNDDAESAFGGGGTDSRPGTPALSHLDYGSGGSTAPGFPPSLGYQGRVSTQPVHGQQQQQQQQQGRWQQQQQQQYSPLRPSPANVVTTPSNDSMTSLVRDAGGAGPGSHDGSWDGGSRAGTPMVPRQGMMRQGDETEFDYFRGPRGKSRY